MTLKKLAGWALVAFIAWYMFTQPAAAGTTGHNILHGIQTAFGNTATFLNHTLG